MKFGKKWLAQMKINKAFLRASLDVLIERMDKPITTLFLFSFRDLHRKYFLNSYLVDLIILDTFVKNSEIKSRGIIPFLANGKHGNFQLSLPFSDTPVDLQLATSDNSVKSSNKNILAKDGNSKTDLKKQEDSKSKNIFKKVFSKNKSVVKEEDQPKFYCYQKRFNELNSSIFDQLEFSSSSSLEHREDFKEIESDFREFIACKQIIFALII